VSWGDLPHATRVVAITAVAVALYQTLGFLITMPLLLFALTFGTERRNPLVAASFSIGAVALTYLLFAVALKTPLERGVFG
ncbi:MAG TPA: tripartite tricarboxylate transporter TctB family protein, partial [Xanthobacteraceae bacterium]